MTNNYLLPYRFKTIGLWMLFPFLVLCLWLLCFGELDCNLLKWPAFAIYTDGLDAATWFTVVTNDPINEFAMLGLLISLCFISLSKEKDEDEMTALVRMRSFVWSFWVTAAVLAFGIIFIFDIAFMLFSFAAVFFVFLLYIVKFNLTMRAIRREGK